MTVRPPSSFGKTSSLSDVLFDALGHEILAEKASALGRAGEKVETTLARLSAHVEGRPDDRGAAHEHDSRRKALLKEAADAVYAFFIQRELCGLRRHDAVIRELGIPREVLVRLGAK
jgi:hypothetical protein